MNQYNKVILCKSLKITRYKEFSDVQQTKVCQNTTNTNKQKNITSYNDKICTVIQSNTFFKD